MAPIAFQVGDVAAAALVQHLERETAGVARTLMLGGANRTTMPPWMPKSDRAALAILDALLRLLALIERRAA